MGAVSRMIDDGLLKPGTRLRSIRAAADEQGVAKNTVVEAYDRLTAMGYVEARRGSGYYVTSFKRPTAEPRPQHIAEAVDFVSLLREQLDQHYEVRVGDGRPPSSWMEGSELGKHFRPTKAQGPSKINHGYGSPWGFLPLRESIALALAERSIKATTGQVLLTQGANHSLDLIVRQLLAPGDTVFVDSPGYYPLFGKLKLAGVNVIGIRREADGPSIAELTAKLSGITPKIFFTQSLAHNPMGNSTSLGVAHRILQLATQHNFYLVEDDPFADALPAVAPRLAALDGLERVIYVGTFSKTLSASLRVGYLAATQSIADALCDLKMLTLVASSDYIERIVHNVIVSGQYHRHLRRLKSRIAKATVQALSELNRVGIKIPGPPSGGYYLWAELPRGTDEFIIARQAAKLGIFIAPGTLFTPDKRTITPAIRINVAYANDARFLQFMRGIAKG